MIHPFKKLIDQLYSLLKDFIWRGRPPKIKHTTLIADYVDGGYKNVEIATKLELLKIMWIRRMLHNKFHVWKAVPHTFDIQKLFHKNLHPSQTCKSEISLYPKSYQELISLWEKVCKKGANRYSRNSFPANMEQLFSSKARQYFVLPRALQKRGIRHKGHNGRARKIPDLVFSKGKVLIAKSTFFILVN